MRILADRAGDRPLLAAGRSRKGICAQLGISANRLAYYLRSLYNRLGLSAGFRAQTSSALSLLGPVIN
jgi:DNA-binding NarL/FixJ family response regulator